MSGLSHELLRQMVESSPDGIAVCKRSSDGWLVVFVNKAFERLTGFSAQELKGRDLRLLQGEDRDQEVADCRDLRCDDRDCDRGAVEGDVRRRREEDHAPPRRGSRRAGSRRPSATGG